MSQPGFPDTQTSQNEQDVGWRGVIADGTPTHPTGCGTTHLASSSPTAILTFSQSSGLFFHTSMSRIALTPKGRL